MCVCVGLIQLYRFSLSYQCVGTSQDAALESIALNVITCHIIPVISSRAGGRKFQKKKETIGSNDALAIFAPHTRVLHLERRTKSTNQAGFESIKISTCSLLCFSMTCPVFLSSRVFYAFGTVSAFSTKPCKRKRTTWETN